MKFEFEIDSVDSVTRAINALVSKGEEMADSTGKHFWANNEEYIPVSSDEWEDYKWIRDDNYLPHDQGFWYSSSMQNC